MVEDHAIKKNEDATGVIRNHNQRRTDNTMANRKGTEDKQWSTKHYTETYRNMNPSKETGVISGVPKE